MHAFIQFSFLQFHGAITTLDLYSIMASTKNRKDFEGLQITANYAEGTLLNVIVYLFASIT